jgi:hypothetical protein
MLITKTDPRGMDIPIQRLQTALHTKLLTAWDLDTDQYMCYGRAYRNKNANGSGYVAQVYDGANEYSTVYWDDSKAAVSFFGEDGKTVHDKGEIKKIHLVFFVNLATLKPSITHRADEEVRLDVLNIAGGHSFGFEYEGMDLWIPNVLREYPGSITDERLTKVDFHPVHCFRLNFTLRYNKNIC